MRFLTVLAILLTFPLLMGFKPQAAEHVASSLEREIERLLAEHEHQVKLRAPRREINARPLAAGGSETAMNEAFEKYDLEEWATLSPQERQRRGSKGLAESQARSLTRKLEADLDADADDFEKEDKEGFFSRKKCKKAYKQLVKGAVCMELRTKVEQGRLANWEEWKAYLGENIAKVFCQPAKKVSESVRRARAVRKIRTDIYNTPGLAQKFALVIIDCGCR